MLALFPMFFASNYFYAYQGALNAHLFDGRTRALNSLLTGVGAIFGAIVIGLVFDLLPFPRRQRAYLSFGLVCICIVATWVGGLAFQVKFTRATPVPNWDYTEKAAVGPIILLMAYYIGDASYQGLAYYILSALTNDPFKLARMAGFMKGIQSAGAAVSFGMDAVSTPYLTEHLVSWIMLLFSLPLAFLVIRTIRETNYDVEDVVRVEEAGDDILDVAIPAGHEKRHGHHHVMVDSKAAEAEKDGATVAVV